MPDITTLHLPVEDLADAIVELVETEYGTMEWPKIEQALDWARHQLKVRAHDLQPAPPEPAPGSLPGQPAGPPEDANYR
jgi:hypothetical protein